MAEETNNYIQRNAVLDTFVNITNKQNMEMGITLYVGGLVITGDLISFNKYLEGISEDFKASSSEMAKAIGESLSLVSSESNQNSQRTEEDDQKPENVNFIHLKNATVINGQEDYHITYWRGSLAAVDGFNFGKMEFNN